MHPTVITARALPRVPVIAAVSTSHAAVIVIGCTQMGCWLQQRASCADEWPVIVIGCT